MELGKLEAIGFAFGACMTWSIAHCTSLLSEVVNLNMSLDMLLHDDGEFSSQCA